MGLKFCRLISNPITEGWVSFVDTSSPSLSSFLQSLDLDQFRVSAYGLQVSVCAHIILVPATIYVITLKNLYGIGDERLRRNFKRVLNDVYSFWSYLKGSTLCVL